MAASLFRRQVALPQDHGSWVFILSPLLVGLFAGRSFNPASISLIIAAMAAFLIRQPVTMAVKAYSGRRPRTDLPSARFWMVIYGAVLLVALAGLIMRGYLYLLYLAVPGVPVFGWHLWLVSRREERRRAGVEILATGVLALAAPAAYWVGLGRYDPYGWWLWVLAWVQSAASIVYAYLRLEQRTWKQVPPRRERFEAGRRALAYTSVNFLAATALGLGAGVLPRWIFVPYLFQLLETVWGIDRPAVGWKPTRIGVRQLIVSTIWTVLFILLWRP
ncbi:MAG: YwiC-like family protein [Bacteroidota bacterium]